VSEFETLNKVLKTRHYWHRFEKRGELSFLRRVLLRFR